MDELRQEYKIPSGNLPRLQDGLDKLNKKATKLGVGTITYEVLGHEDVEETEIDFMGKRVPTGRILRTYTVAITGTRPKYEGWSLIGTIEHVGEAGNIVRSVPGAGELPKEYRSAKPTCDHCHTNRQRLQTFVVEHEDGTTKRVGRNCLADFLGHTDPHNLALMLQYLTQAAGLAESSELHEAGAYAEMYSLEEVLTVTAMMIRILGWTSRRNADLYGKMPTFHDVVGFLNDRKKTAYDRKKFFIVDRDKADALAAIEWAKSLDDKNGLNDYEYNLSVIADHAVINHRGFGLACSMVASYLRYQERELYKRKAQMESHYVGEVGKRQVFDLTLLKALPIDGTYGTTTMYTFTDEAGNRFKWFASGEYPLGDIKAGAVVKLKATIKKHDEWEGIKETLITRAKQQEPVAEGGVR